MKIDEIFRQRLFLHHFLWRNGLGHNLIGECWRIADYDPEDYYNIPDFDLGYNRRYKLRSPIPTSDGEFWGEYSLVNSDHSLGNGRYFELFYKWRGNLYLRIGNSFVRGVCHIWHQGYQLMILVFENGIPVSEGKKKWKSG